MKTVLVTGAAKGIGLATAKLFQDKGWKVLSLDKQFGSEVVGEKVIFDLRDFFSIPKLIRNLDPIDTLVNNAAVLYCDELGKIPIDHVEEILSVNLRAPVALMDAVIPGMQGRKHGRVVSVGSVSAFTGHPDLWYGATKAALLNITKSYAGQFGSHGIIVNAVAPGPTRTDMYDQLPESRKQSVMQSVHFSRPCEPSEVAQTIFWLGSDSPEYISGTTVDVNAGSYPR